MRQLSDQVLIMPSSVSIHAPTRGATQIPYSDGRASIEFQSTHPHGVRPRVTAFRKRMIRVSIHAPTRGATFDNDGVVAIIGVSIHAPTRGATAVDGETVLALQRRFNPRTHTGCDL